MLVKENVARETKEREQTPNKAQQYITKTGTLSRVWNSILQSRGERVRTSISLLRSFSDDYLWERYEFTHPPAMG